jgi:phage shock protein C
MNCNEAVAALVASLESGSPMTDAQREHIRSCERCRELLDSAKQFQTLLGGNGVQPPAVDTTLAAAEKEVRRAQMKRMVLVAIGIGFVAWAAVSVLLIRAGEAVPVEAVFVVGAAILLGLLAITPVVLLVWFARSAHSPAKHLYKRLGPGRMLSGVCLGLAERYRWNVTYVRAAFVLTSFFDGLGFWVYLILELAMRVHPDDRQYMRRFRLRRWLARRTGHAEHYVQ